MIKINGINVNVTMFPDKTSQIWKLPEELFKEHPVINIEWDFDHEGEIMHLAQISCLFQNKDRHLTLNYLPYARQDKEINNYTTFALNPFCRIINSMGFRSISVLDPHSKKAREYLNRFVEIKPDYIIKNVYELSKSELICYPDFGASNRYSLKYDNVIIQKIRDQKTGQILKTELSVDYISMIKDKSVLIVDDICDGGRTFVEASKLLYKFGAKEVNLYITHGIFSKGLKPIKDSGIMKIFTKNGEISEFKGNIVYTEYKGE